MRCDGYVVGGRACEVIEIASSCTNGFEMPVDERVVNELPKNGERGGSGGGVCGAQSVAHAEAHPLVGGEEEVHGVICFVAQS